LQLAFLGRLLQENKQIFIFLINNFEFQSTFIKMKAHELLLSTKFGINAAKFSFIVGTIIFLVYFFTRQQDLISVGLCYLFLAILINSLILLALFISLFTKPNNYLEILKTISIMLFNIPIAWLYFLAVLKLTPITL
jgi:hypothetical protein